MKLSDSKEKTMKLIYCPHCHDIVRLRDRERRWCECSKSWGQYTDDVQATIGGQAIPLGLDNRSFLYALKEREGAGLRAYMAFDAFLIKEPCETVDRQ